MAKNCPPSLNSSLSSSVVIGGMNGPPPIAPPHHKYMNSKRKHSSKYSSMAGGHAAHLDDHNNYLHLNSLWSIWYGVILTLFQGYLAVHGAYRFLGCSLIPWKIEPVAELNLQIVLSGVVFILLPLFFTSAVFKVGNLANDGIKLASDRKSYRCSITPADGLEEEASGGTLRALWTHGGPTAAFVHIVIAMCLLLPRLLLEAKIIENGLLPKENIWQTELDFIVVNRRNLVMQSVLSAPFKNTSSIDEAGYDDDYFNDTMYTAVSNNFLEKNRKMETVYTSHVYGGSNPRQPRLLEIPDLIHRASYEYNSKEDIPGREPSYHGVRKDFHSTTESAAEEDYDKYDGTRYGVTKADAINSNYNIGDNNELQMTEDASTASTATLIATDTTRSSSTLQTYSSSPRPSKAYDKSWDELGTLGKQNSLNGVSSSVITTTSLASNSKSTSTIMEITRTTRTTTQLPAAELSTIRTTTTESVKTTSNVTANTSAEYLNPNFVASSTVSTAPSVTTQPTKTHISEQHQQRQQNNHHQHHHQHHHHQQQHQNLNRTNVRKHGNRQHHHRQRGQTSRRHHARTTTTTTAAPPPFDVDLYGEDKLDSFSGGKTKSYSDALDDDEITDLGRARAYIPPGTALPSTLMTSDSLEIMETRTETSKKVKRMADDTELQVEIEPEYLIGALPGDNVEASSSSSSSPSINAIIESAHTDSDEHEMISSEDFDEHDDGAATPTNAPEESLFPIQAIARLDGFAGMLQIFFGIKRPIDASVFAQPPSAEFVNLVFALLVWCVRYPAVFWNTTKPFATIFSIQMIAAALDILLGYIGIASLYKYQIYSEAMPIQNPDLILNGVVTLSLYLLSTVLVLASSMIIYLYGHGRLAAKMRDRSSITLKASETWIYFAHCASLCFVLALAVVKAPLLNDLSATYRSSLHCATFLSALISVVNLLLWILIWLGLTVKRRWTFKLPPVDIYGLNKATTQPLLMASYRGSIPSSGSSSSGSAHASDQKGLISNTTTTSTDGGAGCGSVDGGMTYNPAEVSASGGGTTGCDDDIYWPKLGPNSPKLKVTFNEVTSMSDDDVQLIDDDEQQPQQQQHNERAFSDGNKRNTSRGAQVCFAGTSGEIDDGEYATLTAANAASVVGSAHPKTGSGGNDGKILSFEDDELPPPPPPQNLPMAQNYNSNSIRRRAPLATITGIVGDYANCGGSGFGGNIYDDNISEEGKILKNVRDGSITYASTRELEPPQLPPPPLLGNNNNNNNLSRREPQALPERMPLASPAEHLVSPLAPVTATVHTNRAHIHATSTPRVARRFDSAVPREALLTPRSDALSITESTKSPPPERAPSDSSSGVHSGEERDVEVVIRPRVGKKPPAKLPQPPIEEEPYGRCTNMRMSSFVAEPTSARLSGSSSSTLPLQRSTPEQKLDLSHCSTMPLPAGCRSHSNSSGGGGGGAGLSSTSAQSMMQQPQNVSTFKSIYANSSVAMAGSAQQQQLQQKLLHQSLHTTLPNGVRYSNPQHLLRRSPHVSVAAESPYGHLGLGAGHHTFSKLLHDPLQGAGGGHCLANTAIPEDRDSANYSMNSDYDTSLYATANPFH